VQRVELATRIHAPRPVVYEFVRDFSGYAAYSGYLREVSRWDDEDAWGYDIEVAVSLLSYTARSEVLECTPPSRIDWRLARDIDANGHWALAPASDLPPTVDAATDVRLVIDYDPSSVSPGSLNLPSLLSIDALVSRVSPHVEREAETVLERIVEDLEDEPRSVDLDISTGPASQDGV
jgi:uncharacterized membrane protein